LVGLFCLQKSPVHMTKFGLKTWMWHVRFRVRMRSSIRDIARLVHVLLCYRRLDHIG
jgi:hypothetical protein